MADRSREPDTSADTSAGSPPRMPRWVKVAAIIVGVLVVLFVVLKLLGVGGEHGPGRHSSEGTTPPAGVAQGYGLPADGRG